MKWHDSHMAVISLHQNSFLCSKSVGCTWLIQCIEQGKCCKSSGQEFCCPLNDAICCDASYCCPQSYPYCSKGECTNSYSESVAQFVEVIDHYLLMSVWLAWAQQIYRVVLLVSHIAYYLLLKLSSFFQISTVFQTDWPLPIQTNSQSVSQSVVELSFLLHRPSTERNTQQMKSSKNDCDLRHSSPSHSRIKIHPSHDQLCSCQDQPCITSSNWIHRILIQSCSLHTVSSHCISAWSELIPTEPCPHEEPCCLGCGCMHLLKLPARQFTLVSLSFRLCRQWSLFLQAREDDSAQHNPNALCCNLTWPAGVRFVILWHIVTLDYYFDTQSVNRCQSIEIMKITIHFFSVKVLYFDISVPVIL